MVLPAWSVVVQMLWFCLGRRAAGWIVRLRRDGRRKSCSEFFPSQRSRHLWALLPCRRSVDAILAYLLAAPMETLGPGDLGLDDDVNGVIFLSWEHHFGAALVRRTSGCWQVRIVVDASMSRRCPIWVAEVLRRSVASGGGDHSLRRRVTKMMCGNLSMIIPALAGQ